MSTMLSFKDGVKARKKHRCCLCGESIAVGEIHDTRTGVDGGDGFWTMRMHPECQAYEQSPKMRDLLYDSDWYEDVSEPAFARAAAKAYAAIPKPGEVLLSSTLGTQQLGCGNRVPVENPTTIRVQ